MDKKTKIQTIISIVLVCLVSLVAYWAQLPTNDLKADILNTDTVLVRIKDFAFDPDILRIEKDTTVSWLNDESAANAEVQHTVTSYDPQDASMAGQVFDSDLLSLGDTFSYTFAVPGVYDYNCSLHPFMTGKVCVGEESETMDPDCAIEPTNINTPAESLDQLPVTETPVLAEETTTTQTTALTDTAAPLSEAADEGFDSGAVVSENNDKLTVFFPPEGGTSVVASASESTSDSSNLSKSGPEDIIYLIPLLIAIFGAKKLAARKA